MNILVTFDALIVIYALAMTFFPITFLHWYTRREVYQRTLDRYEDAAERRASSPDVSFAHVGALLRVRAWSCRLGFGLRVGFPARHWLRFPPSPL